MAGSGGVSVSSSPSHESRVLGRVLQFGGWAVLAVGTLFSAEGFLVFLQSRTGWWLSAEERCCLNLSHVAGLWGFFGLALVLLAVIPLRVSRLLRDPPLGDPAAGPDILRTPWR